MHIDFHSHILPGADHGSPDVQTSLEQVAQAGKAGINLLIASSHFYPRYDNAPSFLQRRKDCAAALQQALPKGSPKILLGAEVQLCVGLERLEELDQLCVEGTNVLLLELPHSFSLGHYEQTLDALLYERKLTVVLAHINRYSSSAIDLLLDSGFLGQLNAEAFCRFRSRRTALHWAKDERVVALGSDLHGTKMGYKEFLSAKKRLGEGYEALMNRCEALLSEANK